MWNSSGMSGPWTQWNAFQPGAYQNYSHDQVDWGAMALQWIQMKEMQEQIKSPPSAHSLPNHIPPMELNSLSPKSGGFLENQTTDSFGWNYMQPWNVTPCFGTPQQPSLPSNIESIMSQDSDLSHKNKVVINPPLPTPFEVVTPTSSVIPGVTQSFDYNHGNEVSKGFPEFWEGIGPPPAPFLRRNLKEKIVRSKLRKDIESDKSEDELEINIDATKRRHLPAWIREGLEKMERERQKREERERMMKLREEERFKLQDSNVIYGANETEQKMFAPKSKFDSDSEDDEPTINSPEKKKSRFDEHPPSPEPQDEYPAYKDKEELLQETMLKVRRLLTEILLEVTSEEILLIAKESLGIKSKPKASAHRVQMSGALSSLSSSRGLVSYGSGSEGSSSESDEEDSKHDGQYEVETASVKKDKTLELGSSSTMMSEIEKRRGGRPAKERESKEGLDKSLDGQVVKHKVISGNQFGDDDGPSSSSTPDKKSPLSQKSPSLGRDRSKSSRSEGTGSKLESESSNRDYRSRRTESSRKSNDHKLSKHSGHRDGSSKQSRTHRHNRRRSHGSSSRSRSGSRTRDSRRNGSWSERTRTHEDRGSRRSSYKGSDRRRSYDKSNHRSRHDSPARSRTRSRSPKSRRYRRSRSSSSSSSSTSSTSSSSCRHRSNNASRKK